MRILVVEDEYFIAQEIAEALEAAGFAVLGPCATVPSALAALADCTDCVAALLDASLRKESSLPIAEALTTRGIPFGVVTGFSIDQLPPAMAAAPVLTKPLRAQDLANLARKLTAAA